MELVNIKEKLLPISSIIILLLLCGIWLFPKRVKAQDVSFTPGTMTVEKDSSFFISLEMNDMVNLEKIVLDVNYNKEMLQYDHLAINSLFSENKCIITITPDPGKVNLRVNCQGKGVINGAGELAKIYFKATNGGTSDLTFANGSFLNNRGQEIGVAATSHATISVGETPLQNPIVFFNPQDAIINLGSDFQAAINIQNAKDISSLSFSLDYDADALSYVRIEPAPFFSENGCSFTSKSKSYNELNVSVDCLGLASLNGNLTVATVYFTPQNGGQSQLKLLNGLLLNNAFVPTEITATWQAASVNILADDGLGILEGKPQGTLPKETREVTLAVKTNKDALCKYSTEKDLSFEAMTNSFSTTGQKEHSVLVSGLNPGIRYDYYVKCQTEEGALANQKISFIIGDSPKIYFEPITSAINKGSVFPLQLNSANVTDLSGVSVDINYDKDKLSYDHAEAKDFFKQEGCVFKSKLQSEGILNLYADCFGVSDIDGNVPLATIYFKAQNEGAATIAFSGGHLFDNSYIPKEIETSWENISVNIKKQDEQKDTAPPQIINYSEGSLPRGTTWTILAIDTNEDSFCKYGPNNSVSYDNMEFFEETGAREHFTIIDNLKDGTSYDYYIKCRDMVGNTSDYFVIAFEVEGSSSHSAGGGSGGAVITGSSGIVGSSEVSVDNGNYSNGVGTASSTLSIEHDDSNERTGDENIVAVAPKTDNTTYENINSLAGQKNNVVDAVSLKEAEEIYDNDEFIDLTEKEQIIYTKLAKGFTPNIDNSIKYAIAYFIKNGTATTKKLGAGERAGVVNSYYSAFNRWPQTKEHWQDLIKIANGRWTDERNKGKESSAKKIFKKIYLRDPNRNNSHDDAAINIIAYGLRPAKRNLSAERPAIKIFESIYKHSPSSADDWDIVRAIAYSGATR